MIAESRPIPPATVLAELQPALIFMDCVLRDHPDEANRCFAELSQIFATAAKACRACGATTDQITDMRHRVAFLRRVAQQ